MSLNWNAEKVEDIETLHADREERQVTDVLVWLCYGLDIGSIRSDNIDEWVWRMKFASMVEKALRPGRGRMEGGRLPDHIEMSEDFEPLNVTDLNGRQRYLDPATGERVNKFGDSDRWYIGGYRMPTRAEVERRIGLSTNVPTKKRSTWANAEMRRLKEFYEAEADRAVKQSLDG